LLVIPLLFRMAGRPATFMDRTLNVPLAANASGRLAAPSRKVEAIMVFFPEEILFIEEHEIVSARKSD